MEEQSDARCRAQSNNCSGDGLSCKTVRHCGISLKVTDIWRPSLSQSEIFRFFFLKLKMNDQYTVHVWCNIFGGGGMCHLFVAFQVFNLQRLAQVNGAEYEGHWQDGRFHDEGELRLPDGTSYDPWQRGTATAFSEIFQKSWEWKQVTIHISFPLICPKKRNTLDMIYIYIHNLEYVCNIDIMYISYIVHGKQPQRILLMEKTIQWKKNEPSKHHFNWKNPSFEGRPLAPWPGTWPWHRDLSSASPKTIFHGWKVLSQGSFVCWMLIRWSSFKEI